jgi:transposase-like protein
MRNGERDFARRKLDEELRFYRLAGKEKHPTQELLRRVRQVLGVPVAEVARELGVNRSVIFRLEQSEGRGAGEDGRASGGAGAEPDGEDRSEVSKTRPRVPGCSRLGRRR